MSYCTTTLVVSSIWTMPGGLRKRQKQHRSAATRTKGANLLSWQLQQAEPFKSRFQKAPCTNRLTGCPRFQLPGGPCKPLPCCHPCVPPAPIRLAAAPARGAGGAARPQPRQTPALTEPQGRPRSPPLPAAMFVYGREEQQRRQSGARWEV